MNTQTRQERVKAYIHKFCVFSIALSLALAALSPALPAASVTSNAAIAVCFRPEENCAAFAVRAIDNAEREILVGAYGLTTGSGIVEALVLAKERYTDLLDRSGGIRAHIGLNYCRAFRTARGI